MIRRSEKAISEQVKEHAKHKPKREPEFEGDIRRVVSTGSTLLDLAISGGRIHGGGIPGGILVEISGKESSGKTVLLCSIAGNVRKLGGQVLFRDPEYRLDTQFARMFGMHIEDIDYDVCQTVPELFAPVRSWKPKPSDGSVIHGIFADSLAALSTDMELKDKDKTGMRRAKEFSEECRKSCVALRKKGLIMVCSNQLRQNVGGGNYAPKYTTPGGEAIGYYSSLRLRTGEVKDIILQKTINGVKIKKTVGIDVTIKVVKSSVWKPKQTARVSIIYDTGVDDVRANLMYLKEMCGYEQYHALGVDLGKDIFRASDHIYKKIVRINKLREEVINMWEAIERKFKITREVSE